MSLTREQYNEIMSVINTRRNDAYKRQSRRQEEAEKQIPALRVCNEEIAGVSVKEAEARIRGGKADPEELRRQRRKLVEKKHRLLEERGLGADYLDIHYTCSLCGDTGYIGSSKCGCFKKLESELLNREAGLPSMLERENFGTFDPYIFDDTEPLEELLPRRITQYEYMTGNIMDQIRDFIDGFEDCSSRSILMMGPAGTGKTFLGNCIAKALMDRQHSVMYERAGEMFELYSGQYFSKTRDEAAEARIRRIETCELLIIDDLGTEFSTDFSRSKLYSVISNRLSAGLSTIISTNLSLNQLSSIYGERVTSRLIGEYILLPFYGSDLRVRKTGGEIR